MKSIRRALTATGPSVPDVVPPSARQFGFREGDIGTHTSRTIMLEELHGVLAQLPPEAARAGYTEAIVDRNALGKQTEATRRLTDQRLGELYALDIRVPLFRVLRHLWPLDAQAQPQLAMLCALARDPLLRATAAPVLTMRPNQELARQAMTDALRATVGERLSDSTLDKVVRNTSSSWAQSGHLEGRTRKFRRVVAARPTSTTYALVLGYLLGLRGQRLLRTLWTSTLDSSPDQLQAHAAAAKRQGLLDMKVSGDVVEIHFPHLLTASERTDSRGTD
jgi:hypothetical protein